MSKFRFGLGDRIGIEIGTPRAAFYRFIETLGDIHRFERHDAPGVHVTFTDQALAAFEKTRGWRFNPSWYRPDEVAARQASGVANIADLPKKSRAMITERHVLVLAVENAAQLGGLDLNDKTIEMVLADKRDEILTEMNRQLQRLRAGKKLKEVKALPSPRTVWRHWSMWRDGGRRIEALTPKYGQRPKPKIRQYAADVEVLCRKHVESYASEHGRSQDLAYRNFKAEVDKLNADRAIDDKLDFHGESAFKRRIRANGKFANEAGRKGLDFAMKKHPFITYGLDVVAPGQRIELDGWEIHLQALLMEAEVWDALDDELKKEIQRVGRFVLCVAIDAATRIILGMALDATETNELAIRTISMAVRDKKAFAEAVGAKTPWDMKTGINEVGVDMKFTDDEFHWRMLALGGRVVHPAAGRAADRARIERVFRTLDTGLLGNFTGRTFSNTQMLGKYKAEKRASLTVKNFCRVVVRYVVDGYHNMQHEGLNGETPFNAWRRIVLLNGVRPAPDSELLRNVFGLHFERDITTKGIRFHNIFYQSLELHEVLKQGEHVKDVDIIVDPDDLGAISVKIGEVYVTVNALRDQFDHVTLEDWIATCKHLHARFGEEAAIAEACVFEALRDIQAIAAESEKRADIGPTTLTPYEIERGERHLKITWDSKQVGDANPDAGGDIFAGTLPALPAPEPTETPPAAAPETPANDTDAIDDKPIDPRNNSWSIED